MILGADDRRLAAGLGAYEHGTVTVNDAVTGEPQVIRIKEAVENVVQSPAFQQTKARSPQPTLKRSCGAKAELLLLAFTLLL